MKIGRGKLFGLLNAISLVLAAIVAVGWVRSFGDEFHLLSFMRGGQRLTVKLRWGQIVLFGPPDGKTDDAEELKISRQINYFGGMPEVWPKEVHTSDDPKEMLRFDLENERETIAHYRQRIQQAEAMGEFALSEVLRGIIVQEQQHLIDLADALGIEPPEID